MAAALVTIATTAILFQFLGPSAKHFGELMLEWGRQVGSKAGVCGIMFDRRNVAELSARYLRLAKVFRNTHARKLPAAPKKERRPPATGAF